MEPLISPERLNLENSNLAQRWRAVSTKEKNHNLVKGVMWGSCDPLLEFLGPPNISGAVKARNFKIGIEMTGSEY